MHWFIDLDLQFVLVSGACSVMNGSSVHVTINRNGQPEGASTTECMMDVNMESK